MSAVLDGRGLILRIEPAESVEPARGFGALSKCCEAAVCNPANHSIAVNCAPRIVLDPGPGRRANPDDAHTNDTEHEWQDPHDRLLISGYKLQMPIKDILFHIRDTADRGQMQSAVAAAVAQGDTDANRDDAIKRWLVRQYQSQSKLHVRGTE
jgi:hypothetical protein